MASRRGIPLPDLPQPTHIALNSQSLGVKVIANKAYNFTVNKRTNQVAPLGPITVMDAIGDLPRWEW
jgi:DNA (cytosine-5)-methyltransferase 1